MLLNFQDEYKSNNHI